MATLTGFGEGESRRIASAVRWVEGQPRAAPLRPRPQRAAVRPDLVQLIRVTSGTPTSGLYPALVEVEGATDHSVADLTGSDCWAYDARGGTLTATKYLGRALSVRAADGRVIYAVCEDAGGSGGIEVVGSAATPDYTGVVTLVIDQSQGLVLTQPTGGQAEISVADASVSGPGVVSVSTQSFAGLKEFPGCITAGDATADSSANGFLLRLFTSDAFVSFLTDADNQGIVETDSQDTGATIRLLMHPGDGTDAYLLLRAQTGAVVDHVAAYAVYDASGAGLLKGATGAFTAGGHTLTITGGIVTGIT